MILAIAILADLELADSEPAVVILAAVELVIAD